MPGGRGELEREMAKNFVISDLSVRAKRSRCRKYSGGKRGHAANPGFEYVEVRLRDGHHEEVGVDVSEIGSRNGEHRSCSSVGMC